MEKTTQTCTNRDIVCSIVRIPGVILGRLFCTIEETQFAAVAFLGGPFRNRELFDVQKTARFCW